MTEWTTIIEKFGPQTALIIVFIYGLWRLGIWLSDNIVKPLVAAQVKYMEKQAATMERMGEVLTKIQQTQELILIEIKDKGV